eukprot:NODE_58_length_28395_cov_1.465720.p14 type:complete len:287 gc:universal NODE_58_length_28395_cov_1.465720:1513-653(-)
MSARWDEKLDTTDFETEWLFVSPYVIDIGDFKHRHPGGRLALEHGKYQDMTDYFMTLHPEQTLSYLKHYSVGILQKNAIVWNKKCNYSKAERGRIQDQLDLLHTDTKMTEQREAVIDMHKELLQAGLYNTDYSFYYRELVKCVSLAAFSLYLIYCEYYILSAFALGFFWHQIAFVGHDLGHYGVTHKPVDYVIGILIGDLFGGISMGWWKHSHNIHHIITNDPHHDPDIQHLPFFAVTTEFFNSIYSSFHGRKLTFDRLSQFVVQYQHYVILIYIDLLHCFNVCSI